MSFRSQSTADGDAGRAVNPTTAARAESSRRWLGDRVRVLGGDLGVGLPLRCSRDLDHQARSRTDGTDRRSSRRLADTVDASDQRDRFTLGDPDRRLDHTDRFARRQAHPTSLGFDFDEGASATESVAIGETLELTSRDALNESLRETFIDEDI